LNLLHEAAALPEACKSGLRNVWSRSEGAAVNCERSELLTDERPPSEGVTHVADHSERTPEEEQRLHGAGFPEYYQFMSKN